MLTVKNFTARNSGPLILKSGLLIPKHNTPFKIASNTPSKVASDAPSKVEFNAPSKVVNGAWEVLCPDITFLPTPFRTDECLSFLSGVTSHFSQVPSQLGNEAELTLMDTMDTDGYPALLLKIDWNFPSGTFSFRYLVGFPDGGYGFVWETPETTILTGVYMGHLIVRSDNMNYESLDGDVLEDVSIDHFTFEKVYHLLRSHLNLLKE